MKAWIVRFASLYVFNVVVLWLIGALLPSVSVGWAALWAAVVLTAATLWLKPLVARLLSGRAAKSAHQRTKAGEKLVQFGLVFVVELIVWVLVVLLSAVDVRGFFWGYVLPPLLLLLVWIVYDAIDDTLEARAGSLYDRARGISRGRSSADPAPSSVESPAARDELRDGLTAEQRRMLDELG
ncbi:phage holin family protein [Microbacterium terricola]|uniref:Phage holin family protein n=1 Tax=Microbacterium terricola TaxID=344163 RepID=A0ABM8DWI4_9MICO|nr:phage holin family protein [Microbacterium terricola]UYK39328.1 phage holin family protein [Microbacterium terricola]BDV29949.1 hypothetical protein Microterr_06090 [Microbacterium terricola]